MMLTLIHFREAMKPTLAFIGFFICSCLQAEAAQLNLDPGKIDVYITPFYNSAGPTIEVGQFSSGLASKNEGKFLATIADMKKVWAQLSFPEVYVAAICLYNHGYRREAVYWYYSAQYRGRQFGMLLNREKMGSIGDRGFELLHAQDTFFQLVGPYISGYGYCDMEGLVKVIKRVQKEGKSVPDLGAVYPGVTFKDKAEWQATNDQLGAGMGKLVQLIKDKGDDIRRQRIEEGTEAQFSKLTNKELTSP
jgi:hypothetical protein